MDYFVTIGIEIHAELKTKAKMFSAGRVSYDEEQNTNVSAIDLALPGTLPSINKEAVRSAVKLCYALDMEIDTLLRFDRKNYFYSDLPKGFQITQQFHPIGKNGKLTLSDGSEIGINRFHLEEDTAKQIHVAEDTLIDFNRAGTPLIEIVSEPEMHTAEQAADYVANLRQLLIYLDVSDGKMEEGSLRCDVNISISDKEDVFGTKVEIKNLNSIANIQKAVEFEINRQREVLESGEEVESETRRFDEQSQSTKTMRKKEGIVDYRYYPEPNIVPIRLQDDFLKEVKDNMVELPNDRLNRYLENISEKDAKILVENREMGNYFDEVMKTSKHPQGAANMIISQIAPLGFDGFNPTEIGNLVNKQQDDTISSKQGKQLIKLLKDSDKTVNELIKEHNLVQVSDDSVILDYIEQILAENPQVIDDFKNGKDRSVGFVMGQVMKLSKGQVNPGVANKLITEVLKSK